jgi:threonine/homoserine/homoserine lactone efflux protein
MMTSGFALAILVGIVIVANRWYGQKLSKRIEWLRRINRYFGYVLIVSGVGILAIGLISGVLN